MPAQILPPPARAPRPACPSTATPKAPARGLQPGNSEIKAKGVWEAEPRKRSVWNIATESLFYELAISVIDRNKTLMYNKPLGQMSRNTTDERVLV